MSHKMLKPFIIKVSVSCYSIIKYTFPIYIVYAIAS